MSLDGSDDKVVRFVPRKNYFQIPSVKEMAAISGQLSFLATSAYSFGMDQVAACCKCANEELGKWWEKNARNLGSDEEGETSNPASKF